MSSRLGRLLFAVLGAVCAHAVTGWVVHLVDHASASSHGHVHHVSEPLAGLAGAALVLAVAWRWWTGETSPGGGMGVVIGQIVALTAFLGVETLVAEGDLGHVLHDPWVLTAPASVVLAHLLAASLAAFLTLLVPRQQLVALGAPAGSTRPRAAVAHLRAVLAVLGGAWGRAPPPMGRIA